MMIFSSNNSFIQASEEDPHLEIEWWLGYWNGLLGSNNDGFNYRLFMGNSYIGGSHPAGMEVKHPLIRALIALELRWHWQW